jgi:hypothetical protein
VFALQQIQQQFIHVLRMHSFSNNGGRMSSADIGLWLGMDEPHVSFVGDSLCGKRVNGHAQEMCAVVRVRETITPGHSYALRSIIMRHLVQTIHRHCSAVSTSAQSMSNNEFYPSLDAMVHQDLNTSVGAVTSEQLSHEMGLTLEDVTMLLQDLLDEKKEGKHADSESFDVLVDQQTGIPMGVTNAVSDLKRQVHLEQLVLNGLYGFTTPVSVRLCQSM